MSGTAFTRAARVLHQDRNRSVEATYAPAGGGAPVQLRAILYNGGQEVTGFGRAGLTATRPGAEILRADVAEQPTEGANLLVEGVVREVSSSTLVRGGLAWHLVLVDV